MRTILATAVTYYWIKWLSYGMSHDDYDIAISTIMFAGSIGPMVVGVLWIWAIIDEIFPLFGVNIK